MTREDREFAKSRIKYLLLADNCLDKHDREALEMAIQALSQEPTDAVSRDALKKMLIGLDKWHIKNKQFVNVGLLYDDVFFGIEQLPSVTQKSKTGHWIKKEDDTCWWYVCSECEQEPLKNKWNDDDVLSRFCPNCGAYMVEPQKSEEQTE